MRPCLRGVHYAWVTSKVAAGQQHAVLSQRFHSSCPACSSPLSILATTPDLGLHLLSQVCLSGQLVLIEGRLDMKAP